MPKTSPAPQAEIRILLEGERLRCKIKGDREDIVMLLADLILDENEDPNCFRSLMENAMSFAALRKTSEQREEEILQNYKKPEKALVN